jgi:hypothetical protein
MPSEASVPSPVAHALRATASMCVGYGIGDGTLFAHARRHARLAHRFLLQALTKTEEDTLKTVFLNTLIRNLSSQASGWLAVLRSRWPRPLASSSRDAAYARPRD